MNKKIAFDFLTTLWQFLVCLLYFRLNLTSLASATNKEVCTAIQNDILAAFEGPNLPVFDEQRNTWPDNNRYVATFGNTGTDRVGDWVKVIVNNRPLPTDKVSYSFLGSLRHTSWCIK